jgi:hypothetical protein
MCCWLTWLPKSIIYLIGELISPECVTTLAPPVTETSTTSANTPRSEQVNSAPISSAQTCFRLAHNSFRPANKNGFSEHYSIPHFSELYFSPLVRASLTLCREPQFSILPRELGFNEVKGTVA